MPLTIYVPVEQQAESEFRFSLIEGGVSTEHTLKKVLQENSLAKLRVLAKKIGLYGTASMKKFELANAVRPYIFFTTAADATAKFSILTEPLKETPQELRAQYNALFNLEESLPPTEQANYDAHFMERLRIIAAAEDAIRAEEERKEEEASAPPAWWEAGDFACAGDSDEEDEETEMQRPYLRVVVQAITRSHDGYCSGIDEDEDGDGFHCFGGGEVEVEEHSYLMTGFLPLKDPHGQSWDFQIPPFDPGWRCASGGSGVCGIRPSIRFVSMTRVE